MEARGELVGHWRLNGDVKDASGKGNHGVAHGAGVERGEFNGRDGFVSVEPSKSLNFGAGEFSVAGWIWTEEAMDDIVGDFVEMYDPAARRGFSVTVRSSGNSYAGTSNDRLVQFGIDNAKTTDWVDCGRPSPTSRYISNSMLVYKGKLYVGVTDAKDTNDWCHVFRYEGENKWVDCGRVGTGRTQGAGPLLVHNGELYAVTWTYDWTRIRNPKLPPFDAGRMFKYSGGTNWVDCGEPSPNETMNSAASYKGKIYVAGGPRKWGVAEYQGGSEWKESRGFDHEGERRNWPHTMQRFNGKLYCAYPGVYGFDGAEWTWAGLPVPMGTGATMQTHSLAVYQGSLIAGTWPGGLVAKYLGGENWEQMGRVGEDGTEVIAMTVYNGKLYGGSLPRAEVCRYDGDSKWTSLKRFHSPAGWKPGTPGKTSRKEVNEMGRVTSLAAHDGKLFAAMGNCTGAVVDTILDPGDVLGKVFWMKAGESVSHDEDLGPGWKHIAAVREKNRLKLYVDGKLAKETAAFKGSEYDLANGQALRIGFGQTDYFKGRISDVRVYDNAIGAGTVRKLAGARPSANR